MKQKIMSMYLLFIHEDGSILTSKIENVALWCEKSANENHGDWIDPHKDEEFSDIFGECRSAGSENVFIPGNNEDDNGCDIPCEECNNFDCRRNPGYYY